MPHFNAAADLWGVNEGARQGHDDGALAAEGGLVARRAGKRWKRAALSTRLTRMRGAGRRAHGARHSPASALAARQVMILEAERGNWAAALPALSVVMAAADDAMPPPEGGPVQRYLEALDDGGKRSFASA